MILGAAYGLAGFIKGLGILAVKQYNVLTDLTDAIQDKANATRREGLLESVFDIVSNIKSAFLFVGAIFCLEMLMLEMMTLKIDNKKNTIKYDFFGRSF